MEVCTLKIIIITIININRIETILQDCHTGKSGGMLSSCVKKRLARGTEGEQKIHIVFIPFSTLG